jgi:hypothetical protein
MDRAAVNDDDGLADVLLVDGAMVAQALGDDGHGVELVGIGFSALDNGDRFGCWLVIPVTTAQVLLERLYGAVLDATDRTPR